MRKFFHDALFFSLFLSFSLSGFSDEQKISWLSSSKVGVKIEMGAHVFFQREFEGFISNENGLFLYATALQPETYEELIRPLKFSTDKKKLTAAALAVKEATGFEYAILPAKNYDGFCFWDSAVCDYNIKDHTETADDWLRTVTDILKEMGVRVGFSYSVIDWHHPSQIQYKKDGSRYAVKMNTVLNEGCKAEYLEYMSTQLKELVTDYGADMIFFDGIWAPWWTEEDAQTLLQQLYAENPDLIVNSYSCDLRKFPSGDFDVYKTVVPSLKTVRKHNRPWLFALNTFDGVDQIKNQVLYKKSEAFIDKVISVWERGGSMLISLDVMSDSIISEDSLKLSKCVGDWFQVNKEIFSETKMVSEEKMWAPETVLFCGSHKTYCLQKQPRRWTAADKPLKLKVPEALASENVEAAWLLSKEGKIALRPVAGKTGKTRYFELDSDFRECYLSLFMPVYGFEY